jgi:ribose transport system permease protein
MVALYVLATGVKGMQLLGGQFWVSEMFNGLALVLAVGVAISAQERRRSIASRLRFRRRRPGSTGVVDEPKALNPAPEREPESTKSPV